MGEEQRKTKEELGSLYYQRVHWQSDMLRLPQRRILVAVIGLRKQ